MSNFCKVIIIILILIILAILAYFLFQKEKDETAGWNTYTNEKYQYSFKYPPECYLGPLPGFCKGILPEDRPPECLCRLNNEDDDSITLQGDVSTKGWPHISVTHYNTDFYNPPAGTDLITWIRDNFPVPECVPGVINFEIDGTPAVKVCVPVSPQAYSSSWIYFMKDGKLFGIFMNDTDPLEAQDFYNLLLSTFELF